ncbi:MAG: Trm112 family protein [Bordetella sp.]|nr:MAG: Trm112 family protein [Bordetella sp.]
METKFINVLVCPLCKKKLEYNRSENELICLFDKLAFPIKDDVPFMIESEARLLD